MNEESSEGRARRPGLIAGAAALLVGLALLLLAALWLPVGSLELLASGLEGSRDRVASAFEPGVGEQLRGSVLEELDAQAAWLRELSTVELPADEARSAARPAESLTEWLADDRLSREECQRFLALGRRTRASLP